MKTGMTTKGRKFHLSIPIIWTDAKKLVGMGELVSEIGRYHLKSPWVRRVLFSFAKYLAIRIIRDESICNSECPQGMSWLFSDFTEIYISSALK